MTSSARWGLVYEQDETPEFFDSVEIMTRMWFTREHTYWTSPRVN